MPLLVWRGAAASLFLSALGVPHRDTLITEVSEALAMSEEISRSEPFWIPVGGLSAVVLGRL